MSDLTKIPTNIITGFLGTGKTTSILWLLKHKPQQERWAVLVNEFGEVALDGEILNNTAQPAGLFIREVAGGCMCCASGIPMQVALNQLLAESRAQRLLIEPTGLGHPLEVLKTLQQDVYQQVLNLQATITLVDARKVKDKRYREHDTFIQQLQVADIIIANKSDLYQADDLNNLGDFLQEQRLQHIPLHVTQFAQIPLPCLRAVNQHNTEKPTTLFETLPLSNFKAVDSQQNFVYALAPENEQFNAQGWKFPNSVCFDYIQIFSVFSGFHCLRLKAMVITEQGNYLFNGVDNELTQTRLAQAIPDSLIEIIDSQQQRAEIEALLLAAIRIST